MAATASTRELVKALGLFLAAPSLPLPDELVQVIEAYLEKHEGHEGNSAEERLHEELQSLYQKHIREQSSSRLAPFLVVLRHLRPVLRSHPKIMYWFDVLTEPILDNLSQEKDLAAQALANVESLIDHEQDGQNGPDPLTTRSLERWLKLSRQTDDPADAFKEKVIRETLVKLGKRQPKTFMIALATVLVKKEHRCQSMALLCEFVQSQPPHLHLVVQTPLFQSILTCLQRDTSTTAVCLALTALTMLLPNFPSSVVSYLPLLFNIYARLLFWDREISSDRVASDYHLQSEDPGSWEALHYSPETEGTAIPQLLNYFTILYGLYPINFMEYIRKPQRYLRHYANAENADDIEIQPSEIRHRSERYREMHLLHPNFYSLTIDSEKTDFGRWLKSDPAVVVTECMALCTHNEMGTEDEDDPLQFLGQSRPLPVEDADRNGSSMGRALLSSSVILSPLNEPPASSWRYTQSTAVDSPGGGGGSRTSSGVVRRSSQASHLSLRDSVDPRIRDVGADSPTLPPLLVSSPSSSQLQDMINSNKVMKSGLNQSLANDSVPSLSLSHQESDRNPVPVLPPQLSTRPSGFSGSGVETGGDLARLQRQIMVLKNDLNFERYMKRQHVAHIGELRRRQVKEAATEAETQNLIMGHRNLKSQLEAAKKSELQVKKDSERSRTVSKKYEADLSAKLKQLRDDQKRRIAEMDSLTRELASSKEECEKLRQLVCEAEVKELNSKQTMQSIDTTRAEMERLRAEVDRLAASERDYQAKEMETEERLAVAVEAEHRAEILSMKLTSLESELQATSDHYQSQIVVLNTKLAEALKANRVQLGVSKGEPSSAAATLESVLAASRAKQAELQKQYTLLMRKYTALQSSAQADRKNADNNGGTSSSSGGGGGAPIAIRRRNEVSGSADADAEVSAIVAAGGSSFSARAKRMHSGLSDPEAFDPASAPSSSPLQLQESFGSVTSTGTTIHRPSTPSGGGGPAPAGTSTSPQSERYFGRGGVQNTIRKERKEKKKDDSEKKEKKSTGLRGIRGFV